MNKDKPKLTFLEERLIEMTAAMDDVRSVDQAFREGGYVAPAGGEKMVEEARAHLYSAAQLLWISAAKLEQVRRTETESEGENNGK